MTTPLFEIEPPCAGQHRLFDSVWPDDHEKAAAICDTCPLQGNWCRDRLTEAVAAAHSNGGEPRIEGTWNRIEGTWNGQGFGIKVTDAA